MSSMERTRADDSTVRCIQNCEKLSTGAQSDRAAANRVVDLSENRIWTNIVAEKRGFVPELRLYEGADLSAMSEQMSKLSTVKRGEGPYQSAARLLSGKNEPDRSLKHKDVMELTHALQKLYREETGNKDPQLANLRVGHQFVSDKNFNKLLEMLPPHLKEQLLATGNQREKKDVPPGKEGTPPGKQGDSERQKLDPYDDYGEINPTRRDGDRRPPDRGGDRWQPGRNDDNSGRGGKGLEPDRGPGRLPGNQSGLQAGFEAARRLATGPTRRMEQLPTGAVYFRAGMAIDADGAPDAKRIDPTGSKNTSLRYPDRNRTSVNAREIPYFVLPVGGYQKYGIKMGDMAAVSHNGKIAFAIFADAGPRVGEGSMKLAAELGIHNSPTSGGVQSGVEYLVFPRSGNGQPQSVQRIREIGEQLLVQHAQKAAEIPRRQR